jgi:hypothetical protein
MLIRNNPMVIKPVRFPVDYCASLFDSNHPEYNNFIAMNFADLRTCGDEDDDSITLGGDLVSGESNCIVGKKKDFKKKKKEIKKKQNEFALIEMVSPRIEIRLLLLI